MSRKLSLLLLTLVTIVTLFFGLRPLDFFPENRVRWLPGQDGIQFYKPSVSDRGTSGGVIYSDVPLEVRTGSKAFEPTTIEIYLESHGRRTGGLAHIVSFHDGYPLSPLVIGQRKTFLVIRSRDNRNDARDTCREIDLKHGLNASEKKLITIASGPERTEIYVNGELAGSYEVRSLIGVEHFCGYLNLGNSSIGCHSWKGNLYGLALYDRLLTSEQIRRHYGLWSDRAVSIPAAVEPEPVTLYTFSARTGVTVHNQTGNQNNLTIPAKFKALKRHVVLQFWRNMTWDRGNVKDVLVNILGFVPFASCMMVVLAGNRHLSPGQAAVLTMLTGAILSLIIEIAQMGLPTRTPSSLDFLCNTLGAALGLLLFRIMSQTKRARHLCKQESS
ncbi:MAG: VanZ family protein [Phycisphaerales bacterium]|nr:MAG: VanZ family protein [Phycisphaerales bacterium]